jgi:hypothetical protein
MNTGHTAFLRPVIMDSGLTPSACPGMTEVQKSAPWTHSWSGYDADLPRLFNKANAFHREGRNAATPNIAVAIGRAKAQCARAFAVQFRR